jgi:hypothetical protein
MSRPSRVCVDFEPLGSGDGQAALDAMADTFVELNVDYLRLHPDTPTLYESGVRYSLVPVTRSWQTVPRVLASGVGDCTDLAAWRAAELRLEGIDAKLCTMTWPSGWQTPVGRWGRHWVVCLPDGTTEDPSGQLTGVRLVPTDGQDRTPNVWALALATAVLALGAFALGRGG